MRLSLLFATASLLGACSSSTTGTEGGFDAGTILPIADASGASCGPSSFVVHQALPLPAGTVLGRYTIASAEVGASSLTAHFSGGGSLSLTWTGDPTTADAPAHGSLTFPGDGGALETWCIDGQSKIRLAGKSGTLALFVGKDAGLVADDTYPTCHQPNDGGTPPPLPGLVDYDACITLP